MGFTIYTCVINDEKKEIEIDGRLYSLVPIPAEPKKETLSDKAVCVNLPGYIEQIQHYVCKTEDIKEFVDKIKAAIDMWDRRYQCELIKEVDELAGRRLV